MPIRRRASQALSVNAALEEQLEDAWVAIVGFQVDCQRERSRQCELEESLAQLELESQIFERKALDAVRRNTRLVQEVEEAARIEPMLGDVVTELVSQLADFSGTEEGDEAVFAQEVWEAVDLRSCSSSAEVRCASRDLEYEKLCQEEAILESYHRELEAALQSKAHHERRHQDREYSNGTSDLPCLSLPQMLAEAQELHERAIHLECLSCEIVR